MPPAPQPQGKKDQAVHAVTKPGEEVGMALGWGFETRQVLCGQVQRGYRIPISSHTNTILVVCRGRKGLPEPEWFQTRMEKGSCVHEEVGTHTQNKGGPGLCMDMFPALTPMPTTILKIPAYMPETSPGIWFHRSVIKESFPNGLGCRG